MLINIISKLVSPMNCQFLYQLIFFDLLNPLSIIRHLKLQNLQLTKNLIMSILGNTKKSQAPQLDRKNSAKLPKLTIQQQIDNNEVIERMNRKITFTKNQRHLSKTLPYVEALQSTSTQGTVFRLEPSSLYFTNFEQNKIYESQLKLVNKSKHIQRIKITPLQKKEFVISNVKYPLENSGDIAPGMMVSVFVRFKPLNLHDNEDQLIIIVGDGVIKVPIVASREKAKGEWPAQVNCGHCWVGDQRKIQVLIPNTGGQAIYKLQNTDSSQNQHTIGSFKIWPTELELKKQKSNKLVITFQPDRQGLFEQKITYASNQGEQEKITLKIKGGAYAAEISLDEINNQKISNKKFYNCLYLNGCEPGKKMEAKFKVNNHAVVPVDYLWFSEPDTKLSISPSNGKISPSQILEYTLSYTPQTRTPKSLFTHLYLYNLPKQSILNNNSTKIINGVEMIECLKIQVKVSNTNSNVGVVPLHNKICDQLFLAKPKKSVVKVENFSDVKRKFWVEKVRDDQGCFGESMLLGQRTIQAKSTQQLWFNFTITKLSPTPKLSHFLLHFDNIPSKLLSIQGILTYPNLQISSSNINFELLRTHSKYHKYYTLTNNGENDVQYKFVNKHRFYQLEFYDFYQFQSQEFYEERLRIWDSEGRECQDWGVVRAGEKVEVRFQLSTKDEEDVDLDIQLLIKDGNKYSLKVSADVQNADAKLSQTYIPLKQLFQGNIYNSNKFLPRELSIENPRNLKVRYEITPISECEQCLVTISEMKGIVEPKSRKRIDIVLEPLKTGAFLPIFRVDFYDDLQLYPQEITDGDGIAENQPEGRKGLIKSCQLKIQGKIRGVQTAYYIKDAARAKKVAQKLPSDDSHQSVKMSNYSYKSGSASRSVYLQSYKIVYPVLQQLNFYNCQINKVEQQEIIIENNSELTTEFQIFAQEYRSSAPANKKEELKTSTLNKSKNSMDSEQKQLAFTSVMGKNYIQNRALNQAQKIYLSNNKGISIMCEPASGVLHKKQSQKITVTMFNDTSGKFKDSLVISIKDHEVKKFPLNIQIKGTPVSLSKNQLGINFNKEIPFLNAGTFLIGSQKCTRNIKLCNNGPREVEIKWLVYPYGSRDGDGDIFDINFVQAEAGSGNIVDVMWSAIKPQPLKNPPFSITPNQKILKGRQQANFTLNIESCKQAKNIQCLVIGEPLMIQENGKVAMEELAIVVEADMVSPSLKIDRKHQNHINKFQKFAVIGNQYRIKSTDFHRKLKLKNAQRCNISFTLSIRTLTNCHQCFEIVSTSTDSPVNKLKPKALLPPPSTLKPNTKTLNGTQVQIQKQFILPFESYVEIGIDLKGNPKDQEDWPLENKIRRDGELIVEYSNGEKQIVPLVGWLYRPFIFIQMPNGNQHSFENLLIDFGVVHVNNHKKKSIFLANPSKSAADWTISYVKYLQTKKIQFQKQLWTDQDFEDQKITDQKKCFRLSHDSGHLLAETIPIHYIPGTLALHNQDDNYAATHKPFKLDFVFKPESNVLYKSKFVIKVEYGLTYEIIVRGRGTYDEEAEIK